jgi:hypothetical protein
MPSGCPAHRSKLWWKIGTVLRSTIALLEQGRVFLFVAAVPYSCCGINRIESRLPYFFDLIKPIAAAMMTTARFATQRQFSLPRIDFCVARLPAFSFPQMTTVSKLPPPRSRRQPGRNGAHPIRPSHTMAPDAPLDWRFTSLATPATCPHAPPAVMHVSMASATTINHAGMSVAVFANAAKTLHGIMSSLIACSMSRCGAGPDARTR